MFRLYMKRTVIMFLLALLFCFGCSMKTKAATTIDLTGSVTIDSDITTELNNALTTAKENATSSNIYTVIVPSGSYYISSTLHIWSNTTLNLSGVTLTYDSSQGLILLLGNDSYNTSSSCSGYNGFENVTIYGGTIMGSSTYSATMTRFAHAKNVTLENVTLDGNGCLGYHMVEVAAIDGLMVKNCTFQNHGKAATGVSSDSCQEALQIDIPVSNETIANIYEDGTTTTDVTVSGCTFSNVTKGVGTHTMLLGAYHTNITISDNTFTDCLEEAIGILNYYDCTISGNTINNCGSGIDIAGFKSASTISGAVYTTIFDGTQTYSGSVRNNLETTVKNNTITVSYLSDQGTPAAIRIYGYKLTSSAEGVDGNTVAAGDYYVSGVTVSENTITTGLHGIHLNYAKNCTISSNKITGAGFSSSDSNQSKRVGIILDSLSTSNTITDNTIKSMMKAGIDVQSSSSAEKITGNKVTDCGDYGIFIYNSSKVTGNIQDNTISQSGNNGIYVSASSEVGGSIRENTVSSAGKDGISVYNSSMVTGYIYNNQIISPSGNGIYVTKFSNIGENISGNTISSAGGHGIYVYNSSTVSGYVYGNEISKPSNVGIRIAASSKVKKSIKRNTVTNCGNCGILIYNSSKVTGNIQDNTISQS
ncbi:MAG: right-handed parallel beta-helix repeat-containing protein, partial [Clostridiales bacterium]|nr:right-handed parallel beta-helix repeat-containing protein [Clostridiales bacterium]